MKLLKLLLPFLCITASCKPLPVSEWRKFSNAHVCFESKLGPIVIAIDGSECPAQDRWESKLARVQERYSQVPQQWENLAVIYTKDYVPCEQTSNGERIARLGCTFPNEDSIVVRFQHLDVTYHELCHYGLFLAGKAFDSLEQMDLERELGEDIYGTGNRANVLQ